MYTVHFFEDKNPETLVVTYTDDGIKISVNHPDIETHVSIHLGYESGKKLVNLTAEHLNEIHKSKPNTTDHE